MQSLGEAVATGDLRSALAALRDLLAERVSGAEIRETAPLARLLADVIVKLDGLPGEEKSDLDDLAAKRAVRRAAVPDGSGVSVERGKRGG